MDSDNDETTRQETNLRAYPHSVLLQMDTRDSITQQQRNDRLQRRPGRCLEISAVNSPFIMVQSYVNPLGLLNYLVTMSTDTK